MPDQATVHGRAKTELATPPASPTLASFFPTHHTSFLEERRRVFPRRAPHPEFKTYRGTYCNVVGLPLISRDTQMVLKAIISLQ